MLPVPQHDRRPQTVPQHAGRPLTADRRRFPNMTADRRPLTADSSTVFRTFTLMKRIFATALMVWYATLATGFYVHLHYCCGNLAGVEINYASVQDDSCCSSHHDGCSMKTACCSFDDFYIALEDEHNTASFELNLQSPVLVMPVYILSLTDHAEQNARLSERANPKTGPPLYRLFCAPQHYA